VYTLWATKEVAINRAEICTGGPQACRVLLNKACVGKHFVYTLWATKEVAINRAEICTGGPQAFRVLLNKACVGTHFVYTLGNQGGGYK